VEPFERHFRRRINWEALAAFLVGVVVAYVAALRIGQSNLLTVLIVTGIGGAWYHIRRVV
jgi:hypothetical protein